MEVVFFDMEWNSRGTKIDFISTISSITGIPIEALGGRRPLTSYGISMRMSWAASRQTTRVEDLAYCLLGIFQVNMPLIYGESTNAFRRLQEEIVKRSNDLTIFAWEHCGPDEEPTGLFASSPLCFTNGALIEPLEDNFIEFAVTNQGLKLSGDSRLHTGYVLARDDGGKVMRYVLFLGTLESGSSVGIPLRKVGPKLYYREETFPLIGWNEGTYSHLVDSSDRYIQIQPLEAYAIYNSLRYFRIAAIHIPFDCSFTFHEMVPQALWDVTDHIVLQSIQNSSVGNPMVIAMIFTGTFLV